MKDMLGRGEAVSIEDGLNLIFSNLKRKEPDSETIDILDAYHRILASDIHATEDLPPFPRSSVDGYAVIARDTFGATETLPVILEVSGEVRMGEIPSITLNSGKAIKIPTGGALPQGSDAVVMFEHTNQLSDELIEVLKPAGIGENVIQKGEDIRKGEPVLKKGHRLRPQDIGALAGLGIYSVSVYKKPVVSIISTGDEIVDRKDIIMPGEIRDINSYNLYGLIMQYGGIPKRRGIYRDDLRVIRNAIEEALNDSDMLLISGGSSVGTKDLTSGIIDEIGKPGVLFHGVMMKPGKPLIGGIINNRVIFGIPGHPAATTICFIRFVKPVLEYISGLKMDEIPKKVKAKLTSNIPSAPQRTDHIRVKLLKKDSRFYAEPVFGKSGLITTLTSSDGIVIIPPERPGLEKDEEVDVFLFE